MPKIETFQDLVLEPRKDGQEMWRWLYTELRSPIIDGRFNVRILIVDDEPLARRGVTVRLKRLLDIEVVGDVGMAHLP